MGMGIGKSKKQEEILKISSYLKADYDEFKAVKKEAIKLDKLLYLMVFVHEEKRCSGERIIEIHFVANREKNLVLHWGVEQEGKPWGVIDDAFLPIRTNRVQNAYQTYFVIDSIHEAFQSVQIRFLVVGEGTSASSTAINYCLIDPHNHKWYNNKEKDYKLKY
jgi:hypothetical protein